MAVDWNSALAGGGTTGAIVAAGYVGRQFLDGLRDRKAGTIAERSASVADADTANAVILRTVEALGHENGRLQSKVKHLERENAEKDTKIADLNTRLGEASKQISAIAIELEQLKTSR